MVKTAVENRQNLIVEGCYIPMDWKKDFDEDYLAEIRYYCLVMTEKYIRNHSDAIRQYACVIEQRLEDDVVPEDLLADNARTAALAKEHGVDCIWIDEEYAISL